MRILMLVNWKIEYCSRIPPDKQPPDYYVKNCPYWFFRYFKEPIEVDVADIHTFPWLERFEKEKLRFYTVQTLKALPEIGKYDLILSHGMQSGIVLSLFRRVFRTKAKHIVFDIGAFNSAAESGMALRLMQFASKSIDGVIYHTSGQAEYYQKYFPWILQKSTFIKFGTDAEFFQSVTETNKPKQGTGIKKNPYILCVGYNKRDWDTLYSAFDKLRQRKANVNQDGGERVHLRLIGHPQFHPDDKEVESIPAVPVGQLIKEIQNALFCVLPLEYLLYSFGQMTLLQQMALSKAVITAKVPSMVDYVVDGEDALLYAPGDAEDLCRKMQLLLTDSELREKIGKNGADSIKNQWNERCMAEEIERYLYKIAGKEKA